MSAVKQRTDKDFRKMQTGWAGMKEGTLSILAIILIGICTFPAMAADRGQGFVTDAAGRTVTVPAQVRRIVTLGGALRFVTYLQGLDTVVGIEALEKKPVEAGRLYGLAVAEKAKTIVTVGEGGAGAKLPDFEQVISVHPDMIITAGFDTAQADTIQQKTGIPVLILNTGATAALDLRRIKEALALLGRIIDRGQRAEAVIAFIDRLEEDLARRIASVTVRPAAYVGAVGYKGKHGITSTEALYAPLIWIHGHNVADTINQSGHAFIDQEKLLLWNPDVIFLDAGGLENVSEDYRKNPAFYEMLKAVKNGRVYVMPPYNYYHTNIEIAFADAYFLGKTLYPSAFADIDPAGKADEIFDFFIGVKAYGKLKNERLGFGRVAFDKTGLSIH
ncbi:MAG: iron ABC transporter substrate-binding protein [Pseudomonadota bacterium]